MHLSPKVTLTQEFPKIACMKSLRMISGISIRIACSHLVAIHPYDTKVRIKQDFATIKTVVVFDSVKKLQTSFPATFLDAILNVAQKSREQVVMGEFWRKFSQI